MSSVVVTSFYFEPRRHGNKPREQARQDRALKAMSMSAIESTTSSPFGISYIAGKRVAQSSSKTGDITSNIVSPKNLSHNKWVSATASNWTKTSLRNSYSVGSEISPKNNAKQLSPQSWRLNGTTKPRSASFENVSTVESTAGKPVLKRWPPTSSSTSDEEKLLAKPNKPVLKQATGDKFKFKSVASLLDRTPWQNDFVKRSNSLKLKSGGSSTSVQSSSQCSSRRSSRDVDEENINDTDHLNKKESDTLVNGDSVPSRSNTSVNVTSNGSLTYEQIRRKYRNYTEEIPKSQSNSRPTSLKINGFHKPEVDTKCSPNDPLHRASEPTPVSRTCKVNGTEHLKSGEYSSPSPLSPNSDIWIKRQSQELEGDKSPTGESISPKSEQPSESGWSSRGGSFTSPEAEESDMSYSGRSYYSPRTTSYKSNTPVYDTGYRPSSRTRLGSPERSRVRYSSPERSRNRPSSPDRSYRGSSIDYNSSSRYSGLSSFGSSSGYSSYSRKSFDSGDDDIYRTRSSSTRTYSSSNGRDTSSSSNLYSSYSQPQSYRYKSDSFDKDTGSISSRSLDISPYDSRTYESRKYSGSGTRNSDVDVSSSLSSTRRSSGSSDTYTKGRYSRSLSRQDSYGHDTGEATDSYSSKYSSYSSKSTPKSPDANDYNTSTTRSYQSTLYDKKSGMDDIGESTVSSSYTSRDTTSRRFSDDMSNTVKSNPDGFEKSSFIRRSLRLGKTREKSEEREGDDQSLGRLSRLRSSLKWSHSKDKEDEPKKEKVDDGRKDSGGQSSFLKRSPKKKGKEASEGLSDSRPTSPTSDSDLGLSPDRALSPERGLSPDRGISPEPQGDVSPSTRKKLDDKKDKVSFFKRFRKTSKGHEDGAVSPTDLESEVSPTVDTASDTDKERCELVSHPTSTNVDSRDLSSTGIKDRKVSTDDNVTKTPESETQPQFPPLAQPETDFDDLDMWSKSIEKDISNLNSAIKGIKDQGMGNTESVVAEDTKDKESLPSTVSSSEIVKTQLVADSSASAETKTRKSARYRLRRSSKQGASSESIKDVLKVNEAKSTEEKSEERATRSSGEISDKEILKSLNAPSKSLPKREELLGSDIEVISSLEMESPAATPETRPKTTEIVDSYVIVDERIKEGEASETKVDLGEKASKSNQQQDSQKETEKNGLSNMSSSSRSRFVRTHGSAKDRIREKKLRREQEEQMRALVAAREEERKSELAKETSGSFPGSQVSNAVQSSEKVDSSATEPAASPAPEKPIETITTTTLTGAATTASGSAKAASESLRTTTDPEIPTKSTETTSGVKDDVSDKAVPPPGVADPKARSPKGKRRVLRRSRTLVNLPPHSPEPDVTRGTQDDGAVVKREKRIIRPRPRTLTQGIDPSLILAQGKPEEEESGVVEEKQLSLKQLQMKFLSGNFEQKSAAAEKKEKVKEEKKTKVKRSRSGKRYKTITEGIAPGILDAARHMSDQASDVEEKNLQNEELSRLTAALSSSTQDIKRHSYLVGENGSVSNSKTGSLATSMEDMSKGSQKDDPLNILRRPLAEVNRSASTEENDVPSLSALKERFLKAVVETEAKHKQKRKKSSVKERPHTICGLDDWTYQQIQGSMGESENKPRPSGMVKTESVEIEEQELEEICKLEGLSPEELAAALGVDPSLNAASYEKDVHERHAKAAEKLRQRQSEMIKQPAAAPPSPGVPRYRRSIDGSAVVLDDTSKTRRSGVIEPANISDLARDEEEPIKVEEPSKLVFDGTESDLDYISMQSTQSSQLTDITAGKRHLKPQRKHRTGVNPVKALSKREDLVDESAAASDKNKGDEVEKPLTNGSTPYRGSSAMSQKSVGQKLWRKVALANEAKSALMSVEDFSSVKLRKVKSADERKKDEIESFQGSRVSNILIHVKGRRHVQSRVVEFSVSSFNGGDSFVIVTPTSIHCWHGKQANVIEKAKAAEIASRIQQKKEMGCKALDVVYYEQGGPGEERVFRPFELESVPQIPPSDVLLLDEDYEKNMIASNMVYTVQTSEPPELVPFVEMCHRMPTKEILKTDEAFVFDFMSEVYVWLGRQTTSVIRKTIQQLAKERFDMGYFKPSTVSSYAHLHGRARKISLKTEAGPHGRKGSSSRRVSLQKQLHDKENLAPRPAHSILLVMFEGAEWVIFREKFCDWPDESRIIRMKGGPQVRGEVVKAAAPVDIKILDPVSAIDSKVKPQTFVFEGTAIERGQGRPHLGIEGYHIVTKEVSVWFVTEHKHYLLPEESHGQFHSGEGYVIRWEFSVVPERLMRTLANKSEAKTMGRQKCAYFFWLGNDCSVTEQAATAVMTVELDKEKGPQVRVLQGKEPPCLLNIFDGGMVIHAGKRPLPGVRRNFTDRSMIRLYLVRNELPNEACLLQVPVSSDSLRSRSSYVLVLCSQGEIFVWHGCKCSDGSRSAAIQAARRMVEQHPAEAALAAKTQIGINILEEGHEPEVFWVALGGEEDYGSLLLDLNTNWDFTPRLFQLSSATGEFLAHEVACPSISDKYHCPFPFLQDDLYNTDQPSIFLLDAHNEVYLWLGWWPDDEESDVTASMYTRWDIDKRKAMESALAYSNEAGRPLSRTYVVYAGLEPDSFIWLFPYWVVQEDITDIQIEEGREPEEKVPITEELEMFSKDTYAIEELRVRPLPQGVNPLRLETYLTDEDFKTVFEMDRQEFLQLPTWKKANIKKKAGLY